MWVTEEPPLNVQLRHSASFSCLPSYRPAAAVAVARRAERNRRTATLPDADYGFVGRYGAVPEEDYDDGPYKAAKDGKDGKDTTLREVLIKKSASLLSPGGWWSRRHSGKRAEDDESVAAARRWRSLGALLRSAAPQASSPRNAAPQSFYLLEDFLKPPHTNSSSDSLELCSPVPPPVPPPPPPLRFLVYRKPCTCVRCPQDRDRDLFINDSVRYSTRINKKWWRVVDMVTTFSYNTSPNNIFNQLTLKPKLKF